MKTNVKPLDDIPFFGMFLEGQNVLVNSFKNVFEIVFYSLTAYLKNKTRTFTYYDNDGKNDIVVKCILEFLLFHLKVIVCKNLQNIYSKLLLR